MATALAEFAARLFYFPAQPLEFVFVHDSPLLF